MIEWETIEEWVRTWLDVINYTFDNAINALTISPFDSSITVIDTAMTAVEGGSCAGINVLCDTAMQ